MGNSNLTGNHETIGEKPYMVITVRLSFQELLWCDTEEHTKAVLEQKGMRTHHPTGVIERWEDPREKQIVYRQAIPRDTDHAASCLRWTPRTSETHASVASKQSSRPAPSIGIKFSN